MGFSIKKAFKAVKSVAKGLDDLRRGDVKGAASELKASVSVANELTKSAFEQAKRDVRNVHKANVAVGKATRDGTLKVARQVRRDAANLDDARRTVQSGTDKLVRKTAATTDKAIRRTASATDQAIRTTAAATDKLGRRTVAQVERDAENIHDANMKIARKTDQLRRDISSSADDIRRDQFV